MPQDGVIDKLKIFKPKSKSPKNTDVEKGIQQACKLKLQKYKDSSSSSSQNGRNSFKIEVSKQVDSDFWRKLYWIIKCCAFW